jgi:glucose-1-phosphate adenylyltransferase
MRRVLAMIWAGGDDAGLLSLSRVRTKASVPFGGHYRLIDFTLSNCANSGIYNVAVLTQYLPESLKAHLGIGKPWDLDRRDGGVRLLEPYYGSAEPHWYEGTGDALARNLEVIDNERFDLVVVTAGDTVYKMDYRPLLDFHAAARAGVTLAVKEMPREQAARYGAVRLGRGRAVVSLDDELPAEGPAYGSLGVYVFDRPYLVKLLREVARRGGTDVVTDAVAPAVTEGVAAAYLYDGYWARVDTVDEYYAVTFECLAEQDGACAFDDPRWPVYTRLPDDPPVKLGPHARVENSIVADGSIINGRVENSVLFRRVYVEEGAEVRGSIVMGAARVAGGASVDRAILDKMVVVSPGARVGADVGEARANEDFPEQLRRGVTLVGKRAQVPPGFTVGRNCVVDAGIRPNVWERFAGRTMPNGTSAGIVD